MDAQSLENELNTRYHSITWTVRAGYIDMSDALIGAHLVETKQPPLPVCKIVAQRDGKIVSGVFSYTDIEFIYTMIAGELYYLTNN